MINLVDMEICILGRPTTKHDLFGLYRHIDGMT